MLGACSDPNAAAGKYIQKVENRTRGDGTDEDGCWLVDLCFECKFDICKKGKEIARCRKQHNGPNWYTDVFPACGGCLVE
ncbi:hypothetical protein CYMTET_2702 [Cymbomonas tetramitiformis]|uniref:Uncharacterized protein n=1 Tax=Cymbomonas tetramitiformis TaxID=36881 RepID=A0AAE0LLU4_9CHLO|nr:hypothetical protein CYMTET_2702 [Cymbomonas tetramitiformis]